MLPRYLLLCLIFLIPASASYTNDGFTYDGFSSGMLRFDGVASISSRALMLTDGVAQSVGRAFFGGRFDSISSFSTTFVFVISPPYSDLGGHGLAFTVSATTDSLLGASPSQYMGIFNPENNGNVTNQLFAVELDTIQNPEFRDINSNHVGIDVNTLVSINSHPAGYYTPDGNFTDLLLISGKPMQVWVDYDDSSHQVNVSLAPYLEQKPQRPLLSNTINLTSVLPRSVYVGFASATSTVRSIHRIIGWSFNPNGEAKPLNYSVLSEIIQDVRRDAQSRSHVPKGVLIPVIIVSVFITTVVIVAIYVYMKKARQSGDWEIDCGSASFTYKDLAAATNSFSDKMLLGKGGFGKVYKGLLQTSKQNVAIKRVSPESKQGMKEFIAEITILGHLHHRNLVQLLGYCRNKSELLLVYDYMPNGSLDRVLHGRDKQTVGWVHRFNIIKGIAAGLCYLHEDWEKVVIHRDIKASNVLLDNEMNGRLGDFGLARLHNHGTDAHTTHLAGTWGYIAPELSRLGRATKATDVFAFGVFMLEVVCGRRPIQVNDSDGEPVLLTDWVVDAWESGSILNTVDPKLEDYLSEEAELVLKLGLLCSHSAQSARPCMRLVMQYLSKDVLLPDYQPSFLSLTSRDEEFGQHILSCPSVAATMTGLSGGR
ncbi:L-type lectin-domain containing receptor kinase SIT2-like [Hordeum vulgare subsp. vulgare]|uniref:non-specific serine/threonine protein kinase n=1 Tax=Hordeum vulgare subsp. vulgare TaxID=112509 RepID=M0UWY8_HORVV|nr:L-type lectin-domain containing receptor kinase SIT2-like [Hordeum vulgare subsp. vulgare]